MKKIKTLSIGALFALAILVMQGCSLSTANMSSLKVGKDKDVTAEASSFKTGDTIHAKANIANNPGKVKVKLSLADPKGAAVSGSDVSVDIDGDGYATYAYPVTEEMAPGSYKLNADMINENGEKKDSKSATISVTE